MKLFEECNLVVKALRYRHLLYIPLYMFKMIRHWQILQLRVPIESCYHASISIAFIEMKKFRKI